MPFCAQDRVEDLRVVDVGDVDRRALGRDSPGEAGSDRDADAALDLLFEAFGGTREELVSGLVEQQYRDGVDVEDLLGAHQQLVEKHVERHLGKRGLASR